MQVSQLSTTRFPTTHSREIFIIKFIHSAIFFFESACLVFLLYAGITATFNWLTVVAIGAPVVNGLMLLLNKGTCPLRTMAEKLGAENGSVTDIFLPDIIARNIFRAAFPLYIGEMVLLGVRYFVG